MLLISLIFLVTWEKRVDATPVPAEPKLTIVEDDILVYTTSDGFPNSALNNEYSRWPDGKVFFKFGNSFSRSEKEKILDAMDEIQEETCVTFQAADKTKEDYILIYKHKGGTCSSHLGRTGGQQTLNLASGCVQDRKVILHELMHALGFIHEHNRSDRDKYIDIKWENIKKDHQFNYNKMNFNELALMGTAYSYESIMHYRGFEFAIDTQYPTIVPKKQGVKMGGGGRLSKIDALRINKYYQCNDDRPKIEWTPGNYQIWFSPGCDFEGHDIYSIDNVDLNGCIDRCALDEKCMDFTLVGKTCYLKSGPFTLTTTDHSHSVKCSRNAICGWKEEQITYPMPRWNTGEKDVWWSMDCDWTSFGTLILEKTLEGRYCGALCREHEKSDGCTHFTWNDSNGGTCYLFNDVESIYPEHNGGAMCGYLDKGLNGVRRRGTAYCL